MNLLIASNNEHKIQEIKTILGDSFNKIVSLKELGINCDANETGSTFYENALIKANALSEVSTDYVILADDTGLCVEALNGEPGVCSARYGGDHDNAKNRRKLLDELKNETNRSAYFQTVVVLRFPDGSIIDASGRVDGIILEREEGVNGFGYDSIFYSTDLGKSFGAASEQEKNSVSHRARALKNLLKKLNN